MNTHETLPDFPWKKEERWLAEEEKFRNRLAGEHPVVADRLMRTAREAFDLAYIGAETRGKASTAEIMRQINERNPKILDALLKREGRILGLEARVLRLQETLRAHGIPYEDDVEIGEMPESGD